MKERGKESNQKSLFQDCLTKKIAQSSLLELKLFFRANVLQLCSSAIT